MIQKIIQNINSFDNILILGFAKEGISTYNFIRKYLKNKKLTIADKNEKLLEVNPFVKEDKNLSFILGDNYLDNLEDYDLIIKSPGINFKFYDYSKIENKITSQMDLFFRYADCKTIGITGTKGKSTTASLIYHILKSFNYNTFLVGNIGVPVFEKIENMTSDSIVVAELSCHQLQFINSSCDIGILLNIYEEHLDLYKSYEEYINAKLNIFEKQKNNSYQIWGLDSIDSKLKFINNSSSYTFSKDSKNVSKGIVIEDDYLYLVKEGNKKAIYDNKMKRNLLGDHNLYNIAAALCVCDILNLNIEDAIKYICLFEPLEHRMERVGTYNGITFYNDSIATIPLATIDCINSIDDAKTVIIGGMDRGLDLSSLVEFLNEDKKIENCIFLKDTGYIICDELEKLNCTKNLIKADDMKDAVKNAYLYTKENSSCILSPAAASYNTYKNFEERGKDYKNWIEKLEK